MLHLNILINIYMLKKVNVYIIYYKKMTLDNKNLLFLKVKILFLEEDSLSSSLFHL